MNILNIEIVQKSFCMVNRPVDKYFIQESCLVRVSRQWDRSWVGEVFWKRPEMNPRLQHFGW